jgi:hypothetical protein
LNPHIANSFSEWQKQLCHNQKSTRRIKIRTIQRPRLESSATILGKRKATASSADDRQNFFKTRNYGNRNGDIASIWNQNFDQNLPHLRHLQCKLRDHIQKTLLTSEIRCNSHPNTQFLAHKDSRARVPCVHFSIDNKVILVRYSCDTNTREVIWRVYVEVEGILTVVCLSRRRVAQQSVIPSHLRNS